ncbi:ribonuclease J [Candidatus Daviesbacteria bacterium]|nr:ribonuclease J [Candidatus Daviesbacteria bacterium]
MGRRSFKPKSKFVPELSPGLPGQNKPAYQKPFTNLRLIPLGGVGDVTKNMYVYEYGDDIIIVDCGVGFPDEAMLGIDLVIPDVSYLKDKKDKIRGIFITHAHDDHIGGLPYLWPKLEAPIYSQKLTCGLIKAKFIEHNLPRDQIKTLGLKDTVQAGVFQVSFYQVSHSVPDSTGIVIKTPGGTIIHQADFKMDWTPVNGQVTDVATVARVGSEGVTLMLIDCLRIEKAGVNLSERTIEQTFEEIEKESVGKLLITMTSSNLTRVQQAINVAVKSGRKLALSGRSVEGNFQVARDLGYLEVPPGMVIAQDEIKRYPGNKLLVLIAGSQGQPGSSLSRAANNEHKFVTLAKNDSVVFSADPIPSTESAQHALIDTLTKLGCNVYYSAMTSDLHVSGHAAAEEIKFMLNLAKPRYILPIGGTYRHMKIMSKMAQQMGYTEDQVLMAEDGDVIEVGAGKAKINGRVPVSNVYVDGLGVGDVGNVVLRDRQVMAEDGIVMVVVPVDVKTGKVAGEIDIVSRGFIFEKEAGQLLEEAKNLVISALADHPDALLDWRFTRHHIEETLDQFFYDETKRRPMILPYIVEV